MPAALPKGTGAPGVARGHRECGAVPRKLVSLRALGPPSCASPKGLFPCHSWGGHVLPRSHSQQPQDLSSTQVSPFFPLPGLLGVQAVGPWATWLLLSTGP